MTWIHNCFRITQASQPPLESIQRFLSQKNLIIWTLRKNQKKEKRCAVSVPTMMTVKIWYVILSIRSHILRSTKIQCEKCRNFCHSQCYGYNKESVGANFECYECLLAESEQGILFEKMYPLCTRRRMVYYLKNNGFNDMEGLCQYMSKDTPANVRTALTIVLDLTYKETQALVEALKTEGIIKRCTGYSKEPFQFSNLKRLLGELFDPSKHISHTKLVSTSLSSSGLLGN